MSRLVVGKWGNSLAVRLPRDLAAELKLAEGAELDAKVTNGTLRVVPVRRRRTIKELTKGMTPGKGSAEFDWGPPVGKEVW